VNLDFSDEQKDLARELAAVLAAHDGRRSSRSALDGEAPYDAELWRELGQLGWLAAPYPEPFGGQGLGHEMLCVVAQEVGRSMAAIPFTSSICLAAEAIWLFGSDRQKERLLAPLLAGETIGALAVAECAGPLRTEAIDTRVCGGRLHGHKVAVADGTIADVLVVAAREDETIRLFLVDATGPGVTREARTGVDPSHVPAAVQFDDVAAEPLGDEAGDSGWNEVERLLERAAVAVAFQEVGVADAALAMALAYAKERHAFGRPIGSFQAIKHKLADVWTATELARANAYFAAWALAADAPELPLAAATARVSAGEAVERAVREMIQVHGAVAATWEHDATLFYRRAQHLALVLGGTNEWRHRVTSQLLVTI
jgi:alkylation response protein AidB-like acyl-CoA dehydrogenase